MSSGPATRVGSRGLVACLYFPSGAENHHFRSREWRLSASWRLECVPGACSEALSGGVRAAGGRWVGGWWLPLNLHA